jgi:voltage-gated potassium channel Kch
MQRIVEALMQPAFLVLFLLALIFAMLMDRRTPSGVSLLLCVDAAPLLATLACLSYLGFSRTGRQMVAATFPNQKSEKDKAWRIWHNISLGMWALQLLTIVSIPTLLPMTPLTLVLRSFFQQRRLARELEFAWIALNAVLAFRLQFLGHTRLGIMLAVGCAVSAFVSLTSNLVRRRGVVLLYTLAPDIITPGKVFSWALIVIASFGCIHFHFAQADPNAYKGISSWQDGLYFSVVTFATVGYGDVYPVNDVARWATMAEILSGLVLLVIAVNATLSVWLQRNQISKSEGPEIEGSKKVSLPE